MYSAKFTAQQIATVQSRLDLTLTPSSPQKVAHFTRHLDALIDPQSGALTRPLKPDEAAWIRNEKILSALDFRYWCERYATVQTDDGKLVRFNFFVAQQVALDIISELEERELPIYVINLKARQLGLSTLYENIIGHRVLFYANVNAVVASADRDRSEKMAEMIWTTYDNLPWWMLPEYTTNNKGQRVFGGHNSGISIQHGASVTGVARGQTPGMAHISEVPYFDDPKESIDASLMRAMHDSPEKFVVLESTAAGMGNYWHLSYETAKEKWPTGRSRFRPMFLPWFIGTDKYPRPSFLKRSPVPENWQPDALTQAHAQAADDYVRSSDYLGRYLGEGWTMPREQMWYWELERETAKQKRGLNQFYQEMPANDVQAFQASGASPFEPDLLIRITEEMKPPWGVFGIVGDGIRSDDPKICPWLPGDLDRDRSREGMLPGARNGPIRIRAQWAANLSPYNWTLVPLKWNGWSEFYWEGKLIIWEPPNAEDTFGFGVDTAEGLGLDRTVVEGMRVGRFNRPSEQIAEYANSQISADEVYPHCLAVGTWYSSMKQGRQVQPRMVIETNANGENTQKEMVKRGWRHFHDWRRYDSKKYTARVNKIGWHTVSWSRNMAMSKSIAAIRNDRFIVNSPYLIGEMKTLSKDEYQQSLKAEVGCNDDRYMAYAIMYFSLYILEVDDLANPKHRDTEEVIYPTYTNSQATAEPPTFNYTD